jgi:hypothetical protein
MKMPELPPLPERDAELPKIVLPAIHGMGGNTMVLKPEDVFYAERVRAYAIAYGDLVREECAKACEQSGAGYDNEWNRKLGVADDLKEVCEECAIAIRSGA